MLKIAVIVGSTRPGRVGAKSKGEGKIQREENPKVTRTVSEAGNGPRLLCLSESSSGINLS
jgi:hypothetical protein